MRARTIAALGIIATFAGLLLLHLPLLRLPYFWDEAGYYIPAALDFYRTGSLIPVSTLPIGHTPLVMIYLGLAWRLLGYSPWVTRAAMTLVAAATVTSPMRWARRVASREIAAWSALLLALSPLFFAQTTLAHLDLAVALFTTLAVLFPARRSALALRAGRFLGLSQQGNRRGPAAGRVALCVAKGARVCGRSRTRFPLPRGCRSLRRSCHLPPGRFTYHHGRAIGRATAGTSDTICIPRFRRRGYSGACCDAHMSSFWAASIGCSRPAPSRRLWWGAEAARRDTGCGTRDTEFGNRELGTLERKLDLGNSASHRPLASCPVSRIPCPVLRQFLFLTAGLVAVYLLLLSLVGGAILPRYLLPVMPLFYLATVGMAARLPRFPARLILAAAAACFVWSWFINPPYPFPFEDNLAYADFIRLHEQAAHFLESQPGQPRILTAWPATDELTKPWQGYVEQPLDVVPAQGFAPQDLKTYRRSRLICSISTPAGGSRPAIGWRGFPVGCECRGGTSIIIRRWRRRPGGPLPFAIAGGDGTPRSVGADLLPSLTDPPQVGCRRCRKPRIFVVGDGEEICCASIPIAVPG